jgi:hypothetical protein
MGPARQPAPATEVRYFVLADSTGPYLLARVRWPDVAQAITAGCRDWQGDLGLFDLPYDPGGEAVALDQAASIAAGWGVRLPAGGSVSNSLPPLIRRMPANWSNLSPAEKRAWALELVLTRRRAAADRRASAPRPGLAGWGSRLIRRGAPEAERRQDARVHVGGRAQFHLGSRAVSGDLVDISQGGLQCVVVDAQALADGGGTLEPPLVLRRGDSRGQIRLDFGGAVVWHRDATLGTHFGIAFEPLSQEQLQRVQRFVATSSARRGP